MIAEDVMYWDNHHYSNMKAISKQPRIRALIPYPAVDTLKTMIWRNAQAGI